MGQGQDPYGGHGDFTPYLPDATPEAEPAEQAAVPAAPPATGAYVPYGNAPEVPYGGSPGLPPGSPPARRNRWIGWVVGLGILVVGCGGSAVAGLAALFDGGTAVSSSDEVFVNDLEYGQCLSGGGFGTDEGVTGLEVVDCSTPHDAQVLAVKILSEQQAADYEFDNSEQIDENCTKRFSQRDKHLLDREDLLLIAFTETETPAPGDKVACLLARADGGPLEGDFRDEMADPPPAPSAPSASPGQEPS